MVRFALHRREGMPNPFQSDDDLFRQAQNYMVIVCEVHITRLPRCMCALVLCDRSRCPVQMSTHGTSRHKRRLQLAAKAAFSRSSKGLSKSWKNIIAEAKSSDRISSAKGSERTSSAAVGIASGGNYPAHADMVAAEARAATRMTPLLASVVETVKSQGAQCLDSTARSHAMNPSMPLHLGVTEPLNTDAKPLHTDRAKPANEDIVVPAHEDLNGPREKLAPLAVATAQRTEPVQAVHISKPAAEKALSANDSDECVAAPVAVPSVGTVESIALPVPAPSWRAARSLPSRRPMSAQLSESTRSPHASRAEFEIPKPPVLGGSALATAHVLQAPASQAPPLPAKPSRDTNGLLRSLFGDKDTPTTELTDATWLDAAEDVANTLKAVRPPAAPASLRRGTLLGRPPAKVMPRTKALLPPRSTFQLTGSTTVSSGSDTASVKVRSAWPEATCNNQLFVNREDQAMFNETHPNTSGTSRSRVMHTQHSCEGEGVLSDEMSQQESGAPASALREAPHLDSLEGEGAANDQQASR